MKPRLIQRVSKLKPVRKASWLSALSSQQKSELDELKDAFHKGTLRNAFGSQPSIASLWRISVEGLGLTIGKTSFRDWIRNESGG